MRAVTWNMNHWQRSAEARDLAWAYLREELHADVALVQEAVPPVGPTAVPRAQGPALTHRRTHGRSSKGAVLRSASGLQCGR